MPPQQSIGSGDHVIFVSGVNPAGFNRAFIASCSMIVVSELGDKTFFIAAIMAMRSSKRTIFMSAFAALALMTALSAAMVGLLFAERYCFRKTPSLTRSLPHSFPPVAVRLSPGLYVAEFPAPELHPLRLDPVVSGVRRSHAERGPPHGRWPTQQGGAGRGRAGAG